MKKTLRLIAVLFLCQIALAHAEEAAGKKLELEFFFSPSCHICHQVRTDVTTPLEQQYKDSVVFIYRDISDIKNYQLLLGVKEKYRLPGNTTVPVVVFADTAYIGKEQISGKLAPAIAEALRAGTTANTTARPVDLARHFASFTPLAVTGAGLIDGINPCAFTVIVFFISFLALQGYAKRDLVVIGSFFIFAVFLTYLVLGFGLFAFFYSLKGVWMVRRILNIGIGLFTVFLGGVAAYDFVKFKKTGNTEDTKLQLPKAVKNRIHAVIGMHYRKDKTASSFGTRVGLVQLILAALVTGFLVSLLEAICTGQTYLPTITFIIKTTPLKVKALAYLIWYNLMFIVPLVAIFIFALFGATSADFAKFLKRHFLTAKALMAILFFFLGIFLLWRG